MGWILATVLTFLVVSLAFLVLANLATSPPEVSLVPGPSDSRSGSALSLTLDEGDLLELEAAEGQPLGIILENQSEELLSEVSLVAEVFSEDTSSPEPRLYRQQIDSLAPGERREAVFDIDLSEEEREDSDYSEGPRKVVEFRANVPDGVLVFETAILPVGVRQSG